MRLTHFLLASALFSAVLSFGNPFTNDDCEEEGTPKCPPGYTLQTRQNNRFWCMKYFTGNYTFFEAEKICRCQGGGSLSGIENHKELTWVLRQVGDYYDDNGIKNGGVWVGAYRRVDCHGDPKKFLKKPECSRPNQFQWTDRHTRGTAMWSRWMEGSPHNAVLEKHVESCVLLQVSLDDQGSVNRNNTGTFDNRFCLHPDIGSSPFKQQGFVCGRPPKIGNGGGYSGGGGGGYSGGGGGGDGIFVIGAGKPENKKKE